MKNRKKIMPMNFSYYKEIEQKLENYAKKGLVLEKIEQSLWTFKKTEPESLKYTVTFFTEGSIFNPHPTDNQMTYFDYAKEAGWDFVCEYNQMQVFSSTLPNPPEFETDEKEKLENIHKCMKKSFVFPQFLMLVVFLINIYLRYNQFKHSPIEFLSSTLDLTTLLMFISIILFTFYSLINYYLWYKKSKKSVAMGGTVIENFNKTRKYFEIAYLIFVSSLVVYMFINLFKNTSFGLIAIALIQFPLLFIVFRSSITLLKKYKISAKSNKIISISLLVLTNLLYLGFVFYSVSQYSFPGKTDKAYTTVEWEVYEGMTREYRLYNDEIPLTCEDLYGNSDFEQYSYEANEESTIFLHASNFYQTSPPIENPPPELMYSIYTPKFDFVKDIVLGDLIKIDDWSSKKLEIMDNSIFTTEKAYTFYYEESNGKKFSGEYVLVYDNKIFHIYADAPFTNEQIEIVKSKLLNVSE